MGVIIEWEGRLVLPSIKAGEIGRGFVDVVVDEERVFIVAVRDGSVFVEAFEGNERVLRD